MMYVIYGDTEYIWMWIRRLSNWLIIVSLAVCVCVCIHVCVCVYTQCIMFVDVDSLLVKMAIGWLMLVGSINLQVSFAKEPYERDYILQKRPVI